MTSSLTYPTLIPQPFASTPAGPNFGGVNSIPATSNAPLASLADGFPAQTMLALSAGGVPPSGKDFNGIFNLITQHTAWQSSGGQYQFSAAQAAAIGGYPIGAVIQLNNGLGSVISTAANNTNDPNSAMTGWAWWNTVGTAPVSVVQYGADPTGVADSTAAIQAAINAVYAAGGGIVHLPAGIFKTSSVVYLKTGVTVRGVGRGATFVNCTTSSVTGAQGVVQQSAFALTGSCAQDTAPAYPGYTALTNAGSFVIGQAYVIQSTGTTNFTAVGASANTVGLTFTATGVGAGTGTASGYYAATGDYFTTTPLALAASSTFPAGTSAITASATPPVSIVAGSWLYLSEGAPAWHPAISEMIQVLSVVGSVITFATPLKNTYSNTAFSLGTFISLYDATASPGGATVDGQGGYPCMTGWNTAGFRQVTPIQNAYLHSMTIICNQSGAAQKIPFFIHLAYECAVDDVDFTGGFYWCTDSSLIRVTGRGGIATNTCYIGNGCNGIQVDLDLAGPFAVEEGAQHVTGRLHSVGYSTIQTYVSHVDLQVKSVTYNTPALQVQKCRDTIIRPFLYGNSSSIYVTTPALATLAPTLDQGFVVPTATTSGLVMEYFANGPTLIGGECLTNPLANAGSAIASQFGVSARVQGTTVAAMQTSRFKGFVTLNGVQQPFQLPTTSGGVGSVTTGGVLTLNTIVSTGTLSLGQDIAMAGLPAGTLIQSLLSGTLGVAASTYQLSQNPPVALSTLSFTTASEPLYADLDVGDIFESGTFAAYAIVGESESTIATQYNFPGTLNCLILNNVSPNGVPIQVGDILVFRISTSATSPVAWQWQVAKVTGVGVGSKAVQYSPSNPSSSYTAITATGQNRIMIFRAITKNSQPVLSTPGSNSYGQNGAIGGIGVTYGAPIQLGAYSLWIQDATGQLRIKLGTPASDSDGMVVGGGAFLETYGGVVASAATITPTAETFSMSGTASVSLITLPWVGFVGTITIIPTGAFTLATGGAQAGNNYPITNASTAVVGKAMILAFDGAHWNASY